MKMGIAILMFFFGNNAIFNVLTVKNTTLNFFKVN